MQASALEIATVAQATLLFPVFSYYDKRKRGVFIMTHLTSIHITKTLARNILQKYKSYKWKHFTSETLVGKEAPSIALSTGLFCSSFRSFRFHIFQLQSSVGAWYVPGTHPP